MWQSFFSRVVGIFKWVLGMSKKTTSLPPVVYQVVHIALVLIVTVVLGYFSDHIIPRSWLPDARWEFVRRFYCGILFLLFYIFVRVLVHLIALFRIEESSEFEDIDLAWETGLDALARAGMDPQSLPLFLVVGLSGQEERDFFAASRVKWTVAPEREQESLVLHVYADADAVFVCCNDVGAAAQQVQRAGDISAAEPKLEQPVQAMKTVTADDIQRLQTATAPALAAGHTLMPGQVGHTMMPPLQAVARAAGGAVHIPKLEPHELTEARRRLEYLCRLVARERQPFCPINGLLCTMLLGWSRSTKTQELFESYRQDVATLQRELGMQFPIISVFAGLERLPGIEKFIARGTHLDRRFAESRAGSKFPVGHVVDDEAGEWAIQRSLSWFRGWIYAQFSKDLTHADNTDLYRLLSELNERRPRLARQLTLTFGRSGESAGVWLAGCYFCAGGTDGRPRAFVQGVIQKLVAEQDSVAWTPERLDRDRRMVLLSNGLFAASAALAIANGVLLWMLLR